MEGRAELFGEGAEGVRIHVVEVLVIEVDALGAILLDQSWIKRLDVQAPRGRRHP